MFRSQQHFDSPGRGARGESDRRVGLNRMGKMTPQHEPFVLNNPTPKSYEQNDPNDRSDSDESVPNRCTGLLGSKHRVWSALPWGTRSTVCPCPPMPRRTPGPPCTALRTTPPPSRARQLLLATSCWGQPGVNLGSTWGQSRACQLLLAPSYDTTGRKKRGSHLAAVARHVIRCHSIQETRVPNALHEVAGGLRV